MDSKNKLIQLSGLIGKEIKEILYDDFTLTLVFIDDTFCFFEGDRDHRVEINSSFESLPNLYDAKIYK